MADTSPLPFTAQTITLPDATTVVEADPAPWANTKEVIILNRSADDAAFVQVVDVSGGLPAAGAVTAANSTPIEAGGSVTLAIGGEGNRKVMNTLADWAGETGSGYNLVFKAEGVVGGAFNLSVTYVNYRGYPEGE